MYWNFDFEIKNWLLILIGISVNFNDEFYSQRLAQLVKNYRFLRRFIT